MTNEKKHPLTPWELAQRILKGGAPKRPKPSEPQIAALMYIIPLFKNP